MSNIYGLFDKAGNLRYIGKANDPDARLKGHMRELGRRRTPLYDWLSKHGLPSMRILEADCTDWQEAEKRLISEARARGERLLNVADGGDEPHCSPEVRARNGASVAKLVHSDPIRKRFWQLKQSLGKALQKGYVSEATKVKMRFAAMDRPDLFGDWANV